MSDAADTKAAHPPVSRLLWWAMAFSVLVHAALVSWLYAGLMHGPRKARDQTLEVVLVNARSTRSPDSAQVLAQARMDGGGTAATAARATTPFAVTNAAAKQHPPRETLRQREQRIRTLEAQQRQLMTQYRRQTPAPAVAAESTPPVMTGRDLAASALAMARLETEIANNLNEYNKRPRKKNIGVRADEYRFAQYLEEWRRKVERVGNQNYPEAARGRLYGSVLLSVTINSDGVLQSVEINRSAGHAVLDDAARRIIERAAPYAPFPPNIRQDTDVIEITRALFFTSSDALETR